jgi:hypothetical protein
MNMEAIVSKSKYCSGVCHNNDLMATKTSGASRICSISSLCQNARSFLTIVLTALQYLNIHVLICNILLSIIFMSYLKRKGYHNAFFYALISWAVSSDEN